MADPKNAPAQNRLALDPAAQSARLPAARERAGRAFSAVKRVLPDARDPSQRPGTALAPRNDVFVGTAKFRARSTFYEFRKSELAAAKSTSRGVQKLRGRIDNVATTIGAIKIPSKVDVVTQFSASDAQRLDGIQKGLETIGSEISKLRPGTVGSAPPPPTAVSATAFALISAVNVVTTLFLDRVNVDARSVLAKLRRYRSHCARVVAGLQPYPAALGTFQSAIDPAWFEAATKDETTNAAPDVALEIGRRVALLIDTTNTIARDAAAAAPTTAFARRARAKPAPRKARPRKAAARKAAARRSGRRKP